MKKKVLFSLSHFEYSNGVSTALRSIIQNIDKEKYEIHILPLYKYDKDFAKPVKNMMKVKKGFGFYFRGFDKIVNFIPGWLLYKKFVKEKFDIEISFQIGAPTRCFASSKNPHRACWMHTFDEKMKQRKYYEKYPLMVTVARVGRDKLVKAGFQENGCDYCYNIIDEDVIIQKSNLPLDYKRKHKMVIVTVARMDPDKAYLRYVRTLEKYFNDEKNNQDVEFWLVGGGSEFENVKKFVKEHHMEERVILFGKKDNPYKYIKNADIYFCVSYREGFSTSAQEAAILGIPVMSVNVDGANELIRDAGCGLEVGNSEEAILRALSKAINNETLVEEWKNVATYSKIKFYKFNRIKKLESILDRVQKFT